VTQRLNPNGKPTDFEEYEDTDFRIKYCNNCKHCYERKKAATPWELEKEGYYEYYLDFPTMGKIKTAGCPRCDSEFVVFKANNRGTGPKSKRTHRY